MKTYLLIDEHSTTYWYARKSENQLRMELVQGMEIGDRIAVPEGQNRFFIERET